MNGLLTSVMNILIQSYASRLNCEIMDIKLLILNNGDNSFVNEYMHYYLFILYAIRSQSIVFVCEGVFN